MQALGIDWKLLIAQIVNFSILLILLNKFLYKPVIKMLDSRSEKIAAGLKAAEKSQKDLSKAELESEKIHEKAYGEANKILAEGKREADIEAKKIIAKAENQADEIRKYAAEEALQSKDKAICDAKGELSNLVTLALGKIISEQLDNAAKKKMTEEAIKKLDNG